MSVAPLGVVYICNISSLAVDQKQRRAPCSKYTVREGRELEHIRELKRTPRRWLDVALRVLPRASLATHFREGLRRGSRILSPSGRLQYGATYKSNKVAFLPTHFPCIWIHSGSALRQYPMTEHRRSLSSIFDNHVRCGLCSGFISGLT